ncbi:agmatinase [Aminipila butyrica]|uniref:Agmatinase n=1 Tax=Aminipila butyrica TaxID=433296 RepID=A0A858BS94_9FIRM|nr:agmatinase [Aminipila butyrica]QIB67830.1 agmatinase [Aminipila butyrica]
MLKRDEFSKDSGAWCNLNKPELSEKEADVVVFGIPFDKGVSYRAGACGGPSVLRENTFASTPYTEQFESFERLNVYDAGDFKEDNRDELFAEVSSYVCDLVKNNVFFTAVGGDHSVTIPIAAGIDRALDEPFGIIHIDAHFDMCDTLNGDPLSHGSVERRALDLKNIQGPDNFYFVGIRSIEPDEFAFKKKNPLNVHNAFNCHKLGMEHVAEDVVTKMSQFRKVYITLDIDCLDPAFAAGTGTPQFGGLYSRQVLDLLEILFSKLPIIAFDVVEVAPELDPSLTSMFAARRIITECWGHRAKIIGKLDK